MNNVQWQSGPSFSQNRKIILGAIRRAKKAYKATGKEGLNKNQNYKYATLPGIYAAVESALDEQGVLIEHYRSALIINDQKHELLHTRLEHEESEQFIEDTCFLESERPGNQAKGAALTYMKKYAVLNLCGISAAEEDDDCAEEEEYIGSQPIDEASVKVLRATLGNTGRANEIWTHVKKKFSINEPEDITNKMLNDVIRFIGSIKGK